MEILIHVGNSLDRRGKEQKKEAPRQHMWTGYSGNEVAVVQQFPINEVMVNDGICSLAHCPVPFIDVGYGSLST